MNFVLSRIAAVVPFSIIYGAIIGYLCTKFVPGLTESDFTIVYGYGPWLYEIIGFLIGLISLFALNAYKQDRVIILTFAVGYAIGAATSVVILEPKGNPAIITFISWIVTMIICTLLPRTFKGFLDDIRSIMGNMTKARK